jgi:aspartate-semialdehyde dehydrogenase
VSRELAPRLVARGVRVIDLSSALRMEPQIPLVVPEVNGDLLAAQPRLIANPNCTSAIALLPLSVIERLYGLAEVIVVSYQAASGAGAPRLCARSLPIWALVVVVNAPRTRPSRRLWP